MTEATKSRLFLALAACLALAAGCAGAPAQPGSLPEQVIVNDPAAAEAANAADAADAADASEIAFPAEPEASPDAAAIEPPAPPAAVGNVLESIQDHFTLPDIEHKRIDREIAWLQRNPDYVARVFDRARLYLPYIAAEVEARGLPGELALLPVVESAFHPFGYSRAQASGLWQFIAPTGERFGLKRNYWQDQRRDVIESTRAALEYLTQLHDRFDGDWFLAIAAYNYGTGNVKRAISRNRALRRSTDFFSLSLPAETRAYVPKLLAVARMVSDPGAYGVYLAPIADVNYFRIVDTDGPVDLRLMAELAGTEPEQLHMLNPAWNRWVTDPDGPHRLLVPAMNADAFAQKLAALDTHSRARLGAHTVEPGESLASIAGRYRVPEAFLDRINEGEQSALKPGDLLFVPTGDVSQLRAGLGADLERRIHRVRSGESLWSISRRHGMSVGQLARLNGLASDAMLHPGQRLVVSGGGGGESTVQTAAGKVRYTVKRGDTLSQIANRFQVSVRQLQAWNNMGRSTLLKAGQRLTIHVGGDTGVGG